MMHLAMSDAFSKPLSINQSPELVARAVVFDLAEDDVNVAAFTVAPLKMIGAAEACCLYYCICFTTWLQGGREPNEYCVFGKPCTQLAELEELLAKVGPPDVDKVNLVNDETAERRTDLWIVDECIEIVAVHCGLRATDQHLVFA